MNTTPTDGEFKKDSMSQDGLGTAACGGMGQGMATENVLQTLDVLPYMYLGAYYIYLKEAEMIKT